MHVDSQYAATKNQTLDHPVLQGSHDADVGIIGAGITGISAALELAKKGYRVIVLDAQEIAWGASGRSGGQLIVGAGDSPERVVKQLGESGAKAVFDLSVEALELVKSRIREYNIDCDLTLGQIEVASKASHVEDLEALTHLYNTAFNYPVSFKSAQEVEALTGSRAYYGGCYDALGGHIHPLNYTLGLARAAEQAGVEFFTRSPATKIQPGDKQTIHTAKGSVQCEYVVVAANAYLDRLVPALSKYILPVGSYICATEPVPAHILPENPAVVDSKYLLSYFRKDTSGRLLWGGRTGLTKREPSNLRSVMQHRIQHAFPSLEGVKIEKSWGGNIAITMNRMPQFGRLARNQFFIHGYSGHGMALANIGGKTLAEAIGGHAERFDLFANIPHQPFFGGTLLRAPALAAAMVYFKVRDLLS